MGDFYLSSAELRPDGKLRVGYSRAPLASDPNGPTDALNPARYSLAGPGSAAVALASAVDGDARSVDLGLSAALAPGRWALAVSGVVGPGRAALSAPTSLPLTVPAGARPPGASGGRKSPGPEEQLRRAAGPTWSGKMWSAILAAIAAGDKLVRDNAAAIADQMHVASASGRYLRKRAADSGAQLPSDDVGMSDSLLRQLAVRQSTKLTLPSILSVLEVFYGPEATRAFQDAGNAEPYALSDGDDLRLLIDERDAIAVAFAAADFADITKATAIELAAAIGRALRAVGSAAFAVQQVDSATRLRLYSGSLGLGSGIRVTGGRAQNALRFPTALGTASGAPGVAVGQGWSVSLPLPGTARFTRSGATATDLTLVRVGDYANIFGSAVAAANQGSFPITAVDVRYVSGALTQYFEVANAGAQAQSFTTAAAADILFFRPTRSSPAAGPNSVSASSSTPQVLDVELPATTRIVQRAPGTAAYLQSAAALSPTSASQDGSGLISLTFASPHGLSAGSQVILDGYAPASSPPAVNAGNGTSTMDASPVTLLSSQQVATATYPSLQRGGVALLGNGDAYVAGGQDSALSPSSSAGRFRIAGPSVLGDGSAQYSYSYPATAPLANARYDCTATALTDAVQGGKAWVAGGSRDGAPLLTTQLYDPSGNSYSSGPALPAERRGHAAVLLSSKKVMLVAGISGANEVATTDVYDPVAGTVSAGPSLLQGRGRPCAAVLPDGRVLVVGGSRGVTSPAGETDGSPLATCEIFDGASWSRTGGMSYARVLHQLAVLPDGSVMAIGGYGCVAGRPDAPGYLRSCEVWDPTTGRWYPLPDMGQARGRHAAALSGGKVWVAGGEQAAPYQIEVFDPATRTWAVSPAAAPAARPDWQYGALLPTPSGPLAWAGGVRISTGPDATTTNVYVIVPASDAFSRGQNNAVASVASTPTASTATVRPSEAAGYSKPTGSLTVAPAAAAATNVPGPYLFDPSAGLAVTATSTTTTQAISGGTRQGVLAVTDASGFPDAPGYVALGFGTAQQAGPVPYLGRIGGAQLMLDYSFQFQGAVAAGSSVTLLAGKGPLAPAAGLGGAYLTGSEAGRVAAQLAVEGMVAAGLRLAVDVRYPGDRGLGGEGLPKSEAQKLSDEVGVWAGDDVDAAVADARS
jgi:hypothetical protein